MKTNGKLWSQRASLAGILALALTGAGPALAGEPDEPAVVGDPDATERALTLPDEAAPEVETDAAFGLDTANEALELDADARERGDDFGRDTAGEAQGLGAVAR